MSEDLRTRVANFLDDLEELSRKYGVKVNGCGDCGCPWVEKLNGLERDLEYRYRVAPDSWDNPLSIEWSNGK